MKVPKNLKYREQGICNENLPVELSISLLSNSPVTNFYVTVDNTRVDSHRVCILFNSEIYSKFSIADHQFGAIKKAGNIL